MFPGFSSPGEGGLKARFVLEPGGPALSLPPWAVGVWYHTLLFEGVLFLISSPCSFISGQRPKEMHQEECWKSHCDFDNPSFPWNCLYTALPFSAYSS